MLSRFSHAQLYATLWSVAHQTPLSMGFSKQEYWSGLHALLQGIFLTQGSNPHLLFLLHWQVGSLPLAPPEKPNMSNTCYQKSINFSLWISDKVVAQPCPTLCDHHGLQPARLFCPWNSPGKNIGVDCYYLLQGSSWPMDWTQVSCIAGRFFTIWATGKLT